MTTPAPDSYQHNGLWLVRRQATTEAIDRFTAMTEQVDSGQDQPCIVFTGGSTFYVDAATITTPRKFIYEYLTGDELPPGTKIRLVCHTPKCVRFSHLEPIFPVL